MLMKEKEKNFRKGSQKEGAHETKNLARGKMEG